MSRPILLTLLLSFVVGCALDRETPDTAELDALAEQHAAVIDPLPHPHVVPQNCCYAPPPGPATPYFCQGSAAGEFHALCFRHDGTTYPAQYCGVGLNGCKLGDGCTAVGPGMGACDLAQIHSRTTPGFAPAHCLGDCDPGINDFPPVPRYQQKVLADGSICCAAVQHRNCNSAVASLACGCSDGAAAVTDPSVCGNGATPMVGTPYYCCIPSAPAGQN